jgi:hypothetical protein
LKGVRLTIACNSDGKPRLELLTDIRQRLENEFSQLDDDVKSIENPVQFAVEISPEPEKLQDKVIHRVIEKELGES